ncbi:MAG: ice-binding family protein [Acidobacteriota bacterium]
MAHAKRFNSGLIAAVLLFSAGSLNRAWGQSAPAMGTATNFAVLGASAVTNTGPSIVTGDIGVSPGSSITGFPPGSVTGTIHAADAAAAQALDDAATAYGVLAAEACNTNLTGQDLGGLILTPGVYCFNSSAQLTGILILDTLGDPNGVFVFRIGSTLTTASNSAIIVSGGSPCGVYFQVGSSATLGTGTQFSGNIFAFASITINTGATVTGGSYALNGAVTLDTNSATACRGTLQVCKVAGSGVVEGTNFSFDVAGTPVTIAAGAAPLGTCSVPLVVPAQPATITETIPSGTVLASVNASPGAGLLISSDLAVGTATVAVNPGGQTVATFIDTVPPPPIAGFLQICKIAGSGVTPGTNFTFSAGGTPVTVAAGLPSGGTCAAALTVPAGHVLISETLPNATVMTDVSTLPSAGLLVASDLAAGTATVTVNAGVQTIVTFTDAISPTAGFLQICKVTGTGIVEGANFSFVAALTPVTVPAGPAPGGSCSTLLAMPAGPITITETLPIGVLLTTVSTSPFGMLVSSDLPAGRAMATINPGGTTVVTFQNARTPIPPTGFLQVCKVAGAGIGIGTNFLFSVAGTPVTVPAGPPPAGYCGPAFAQPAGSVTVAETLLSGTVLTSVATLPSGLLVSSNLGSGTATVTVQNGGQTIVTFVDTMPVVPPTTGFLQVCKAAGAGIAVGTNFTFNVAGTTFAVPAGPAPGGFCSSPIVEPPGPVIVSETLPAGTALTAVTTIPAGLLVSSNLAAGTATVTVNAGEQTFVTFLDAVIPVVPRTGFVQICKVAGAGITVGTPFAFSVAGTPVTVLAGPAPAGSCSTPLVMPVGATFIAETASQGTVLSSVTTLPSGLLVSSNPAAGTATVTVNDGGQTIVTFLNTIVSGTPLGLLEICKFSGAGVAPGASFSFNVGGTTVNVPAGSCVSAATLPVGTSIMVAETPSMGTTVSAINVIPSDRQGAINLSGGTVAVTIGTGVTEVDFTNTAGGFGLLKVCKIAGSGITAGRTFAFAMGSATFTVPAGYCVQNGLFPVGTVVTITEGFSSTSVASAISVLPASQQGTVDLTAQTVTATIGVGVTEVYFTNVGR